jgi:1-acyl-sn-glycerol-3-phosphate acyltransferase
VDLNLDAATVRTVLPTFLSSVATSPADAAVLKERVIAHIDSWSDDEVVAAVDAIRQVGTETRVWPAEPRLRLLARDYCAHIFTDAIVDGVHHLVDAAASAPVLLIGNHLAYIDSLAIDHALCTSGHHELADRIVSVAGPKVYTELFRRLAATCLHTVPAPQSTQLAHTARMSNKDLARMALASLGAARSALSDGQVMLVYGEGSRTRDRRLKPFLRGVHRYLGLLPDQVVVPFALTGIDAVMPVGIERITPSPVRVSFGAPFAVADADGTRQALERAWHSVAALLPEAYAPSPDESPIA